MAPLGLEEEFVLLSNDYTFNRMSLYDCLQIVDMYSMMINKLDMNRFVHFSWLEESLHFLMDY